MCINAMIVFKSKRMMGTIATRKQPQETTMKRNPLTQNSHLVTVLLRWIQTYYVHKFERYVATHELAV